MSRRPRASGYFRTGYAQDLGLIETRTERLAARCAGGHSAGVSVLRLALPARSGQPGFPRLHRRPRADAADGLRGPGLARPRRTAGGRRLHGRHPVQGSAGAVLDHAAGGGAGRRAARRRVRPAVAAPARALSGGEHAGAAFPRRLPGRRVRGQARLLDRHPHRSALDRRHGHHRRPRVVFHPGCGRARHAAALPQPAAQRHRARLGRHPRQRDGGGGARHRRGRPQAARLRRSARR